MSRPVNQPLPDGYVLHPALKARGPLRHPLGAAKRVSATDSLSGFEQYEKTCANCGAVRVTIIGGPIARAWRIAGDNEQRPFEPVCGAQREMADPVCGAKGQG